MTHDPLFSARLLTHPAILSAALLHDFIPYHAPDRYLARPGERLAYHAALAWLPRYHLFFANSKTTARDFAALSGRGRACCIVGAPLDPAFIRPAPHRERPFRYVLVAGGEDPRKNVTLALRAYAASALAGSGVALTITGFYPPPARARLAAAFAAAGGARGSLHFSGPLSSLDLACLYRDALTLVCPSWAEGFSLPVIEGMAAGTPVIASAIPAHRELIEDPALLFAPDDAVALRRLLERIAAEPDFRSRVLAAQAPIWPRFRAPLVARAFWGAILTRSRTAPVPAPMALRGARPRLALLSPLPPARSGCADYTAAIAPELGRRVALHVFTATPRPCFPQGAASVRPLSALAPLSGAFDRVVAVMGNSDLHLGIFRLLLRYGGACIAHDARLLGFYRGPLGMARARALAAVELGRPVAAAEIEAWLADESKLPTLFLSELAQAAEPLFFHSAITAALVAERYGRKAQVLPFALQRVLSDAALSPSARKRARERLGIGAETDLIATFGNVDASKCPEECIWALALLRGWGFKASLHFVGRSWSDPAPLRALARELGLAGSVLFTTEYVSEARYRDYLAAADVGVQLRAYGFGSLSGALSDCVAAGLPSVATAELAETLGAPAYVRAIPDAVSPVLLADAIADLLAAKGSAVRLTPARAAYIAAHSPRVYAERLLAALGLAAPGA